MAHISDTNDNVKVSIENKIVRERKKKNTLRTAKRAVVSATRSPSYDVNATTPVADNDIDLKVCSGKKFNAVTVATISRQFRHSAKVETRVANESQRESSAGGPWASFLPKIIEFTI